MKLSQYAKVLGIHYRTAWNMFKKNQIPGAYQLPTSTIIVPDIDSPKNGVEAKETKVCIYTRVSSSMNRKNLESQAERVGSFCAAKGWKVVRVAKEVASGINDNRPILRDILNKIGEYDMVVVEHKDRLTRLGFNYFSTMLPNKVYVINEAKDKTDDLMTDLVAIITSFCARLYGQRRGKRKTKEIIKELNTK
jgi:predicted site-specific integrase-resolvase